MYPINLKECVGNFQRFQQLRSFRIFTAPLPESLHWFSFSLVSSQLFCIVWSFYLIFFYSAHFLRKEWVTFIFAPSSLSDDFFSSNICVSTCTPIVRFASIACFPIFCFFRAVVAAKIDLLVASFARVAASLLICYCVLLLLL